MSDIFTVFIYLLEELKCSVLAENYTMYMR